MEEMRRQGTRPQYAQYNQFFNGLMQLEHEWKSDASKHRRKKLDNVDKMEGADHLGAQDPRSNDVEAPLVGSPAGTGSGTPTNTVEWLQTISSMMAEDCLGDPRLHVLQLKLALFLKDKNAVADCVNA